MRIPVLYIRVSSSKQVQDGGGLDDQLSAGESYIKSIPDLDYGRIQILRDEGISSFKGGNLEEGMPLREFVEQRLTKKDGDNYALIVYSVDRISRMNPWASSQFIGQTIMSGVHIHDISSRQILRQDDHIGSIISTLNLMRANSESALKSKRRLDSIESSIAESLKTGEALKGKLPKWLYIEDKKYKVKEDLAKTISDAVDMYIGGHTSGEIVKKLNESGLLYGDKEWSGPFLIKLIKSPTIMGTYTRIKDGVPLSYDNFYPAIVSNEKFEKVNALIKSVGAHITKHRVDKGRVSNLFSGFFLCAECGGVININRHSTIVKYFTCSNNYRRKLCTAKKGNYLSVERAVLEHIKGLDLSSLLTNSVDTSEIDMEITQVRNNIHSLEESISRRKKDGKLIPVEIFEALADSRERLSNLKESLPQVPLVDNISIGCVDSILDDVHPSRGLIHRGISDIVKNIKVYRVGQFIILSISYERIPDVHVIIIDNSSGKVLSAVSQTDKIVELYGIEDYKSIVGDFIDKLPNNYLRFNRK
ncbi:recombinase family protein [Yersinia enterocolitica]|uniref:recombinase family protein n=1 Tax=Yersinia enterocolitica TaxID=630 RepID=UPI003D78FCAB